MRAGTPELTKLANRTVLQRTIVGNPNAAAGIIPLLYGTAYGTKFKTFKPRGKRMDIIFLSAFWPDAHTKPKSKWTGVWNLEVSPFVRTKDLVQKDPEQPVRLDVLKGGTYAQVLHVGPYAAEKPTIEKLHAFVRAQGYALAGPHEEVYLSKPGPKARTIIRYRVARKR